MDCSTCDFAADGDSWCNGELFVVDLMRVPAADVKPIVRASWLTGNNNPRTYGRIRAMCGRCGAFALYDMVNAGSFKEKTTNFCPNCGACMIEDKRDCRND